MCWSILVSAVREAEAATAQQSSRHTGRRLVPRLARAQVNEDPPSTAIHGLRCVFGAAFCSLRASLHAHSGGASGPGLVKGQRRRLKALNRLDA
jgi:hypothetical protein